MSGHSGIDLGRAGREPESRIELTMRSVPVVEIDGESIAFEDGPVCSASVSESSLSPDSWCSRSFTRRSSASTYCFRAGFRPSDSRSYMHSRSCMMQVEHRGWPSQRVRLPRQLSVQATRDGLARGHGRSDPPSFIHLSLHVVHARETFALVLFFCCFLDASPSSSTVSVSLVDDLWRIIPYVIRAGLRSAIQRCDVSRVGAGTRWVEGAR